MGRADRPRLRALPSGRACGHYLLGAALTAAHYPVHQRNEASPALVSRHQSPDTSMAAPAPTDDASYTSEEDMEQRPAATRGFTRAPDTNTPEWRKAERAAWSAQLSSDNEVVILEPGSDWRAGERLHEFAARWIAQQAADLPRFSKVAVISFYHVLQADHLAARLGKRGCGGAIRGRGNRNVLISNDAAVMIVAKNPTLVHVPSNVDVEVYDLASERIGPTGLRVTRSYLQPRRAAVCRELDPFLVPDLARMCAQYVS